MERGTSVGCVARRPRNVSESDPILPEGELPDKRKNILECHKERKIYGAAGG